LPPITISIPKLLGGLALGLGVVLKAVGLGVPPAARAGGYEEGRQNVDLDADVL
jgi:hypothetical protein